MHREALLKPLYPAKRQASCSSLHLRASRMLKFLNGIPGAIELNRRVRSVVVARLRVMTDVSQMMNQTVR